VLAQLQADRPMSAARSSPTTKRCPAAPSTCKAASKNPELACPAPAWDPGACRRGGRGWPDHLRGILQLSGLI
jgi:hypothetical protein